jgi:hypothetical protein
VRIQGTGGVCKESISRSVSEKIMCFLSFLYECLYFFVQ